MAENTYSQNAICYLNERERYFTVWSLFLTSIQYFNRALKISDFNALVSALDAGFEAGFDERMRFAREALMDSVKFTICFENYFKAKALEAGYLIHEIRKGMSKALDDLRKLQKKKPILISEYLTHDSFESDPANSNRHLPGLSPYTLPISIFWKENYGNLTIVPKDLMILIEGLAQRRNSLHFLLSHGDAYNPVQLISDLKSMTAFVNESMVNAANDMIVKYRLKESLRQNRIELSK